MRCDTKRAIWWDLGHKIISIPRKNLYSFILGTDNEFITITSRLKSIEYNYMNI